jgi:hypothetical protein
MSWAMYPSKNIVFFLFYASEQDNVLKMLANRVYYLSWPPHFHQHPVGGGGGGRKRAGGGEESCIYKTEQKTVQGKNGAICLLIVGLTDL